MQKELTRGRVIEAALEVFEEKGFTPATIDDIAKQAALNRGTIYLHFQNKAEILQAAAARLPSIVHLLEDVLGAPDRAERRAAFGRLYANWENHLGPVWRHLREAAAVDPTTNDWIMRIVLDQTAITQRSLEQRGVSRKDARARAFLLLCMWSEFVYRMGQSGSQPDKAASLEALVDFIEAAHMPGPLSAR